jgi:drug/metabolite transporter (DMT)-like permease
MSETPSQTLSPPEGTGARIRNAFIGAFFVLVLLIPKLLHLRRNARSWLFFRILLALAGASLILLPVGLSNSYVLSLVGLAMFTASILLPSAKPDTGADDKARELGALVVVNGGKFKVGETPSFAAQLFVGSDYVRVAGSCASTGPTKPPYLPIAAFLPNIWRASPRALFKA